jgi:hypothetical protein
MKIIFNEHLNPRPYRMAPHVKFHIQKRSDIDGVALCGGIYPADRYAVFSAEFVSSFDTENQCQCCMKEHHDSLTRVASALDLAVFQN